uniref:Uncharacterized protein n=1 Tax=Rhizophora mucronata TaxID=61149 RepID=A0A2P2PLW7_RHIMU
MRVLFKMGLICF